MRNHLCDFTRLSWIVWIIWILNWITICTCCWINWNPTSNFRIRYFSSLIRDYFCIFCRGCCFFRWNFFFISNISWQNIYSDFIPCFIWTFPISIGYFFCDKINGCFSCEWHRLNSIILSFFFSCCI